MPPEIKIKNGHPDITIRYTDVRNFSLKLCEPLEKEDFVAQPISDVSPPKWHLAHTTWFFEQFVLRENVNNYQVFDPNFNYLFNSYYKTVGDHWIRAKRGTLTRPTVDDVLAYRAHVDDAMIQFLDVSSLSEQTQSVIEVGLHHEQQHQELLLYDIKAILGYNPIFPTYRTGKPYQNIKSKMDWLSVEGGLYTIGHQGSDFCYDNELGVHQVHLMPFAIADSLVTNGDYLEFIRDDGYTSFKYWMSDGWDWVQANGISSPEYWHKFEGDWKIYSLEGLMNLDLDEPVSHVSFYEADAYARWKGFRLPSEFEWEVACKEHDPTIPKSANFADNDILKPVTTRETQFYGNLWEWTESAYRPYPYFTIADGAIGEYNGKFMINQMVLRGGSFGTSRNHIRSTYRNFFHPHLRWMFSGIRLAQHI
jgi:ergothioneine biosynthesis protein EgtB